ncbi:branched-chain-amino-acid transaminase [Halobacteriovorax sp. BALOs_7]|uniref:Branched-chain-amino-acid aminotransferase n=1 Tax=Halobacteriovorax vibrionivorans TaxID=2152716 RepID=A0ABY0IFE2_9BACT|nr:MULTISPECIES: branched-chain amino acid aminotransferase [Halobacteriovorax]AYF44118.1 branched-chain-amino-acid transaminase [Halobacteriovorax sp. BALOs_7]RZF21357.1 branched-chain amino acid aminotransferase [Halobacteriovorax vibrionivorans]TGD47885.1 branched-chain amino acid aminotransferase [Halobacteriovorax sp. Y22]
MKVLASAKEAIENFSMPDKVGFGKVLLPIMATCEFKRGEWGELEIRPYAKLELDPTCKVLHYGQEIFEGMKAYNYKGNGPNLFRPLENFKRFNHSARRMAMPEVPNEIFVNAVNTITKMGENFIPKRSGESLYIRPFMIATENNLGIKPSEEFLFMVIASPVESYFSGGSYKVLIERQMVRACPGGMGTAKTGGNYAGALNSGVRTQKLGLHQSLWLSASDRKSIEELSGMNFFAVIDGEIHTPELTETILDGITRRSLIDIARSKGLKVIERKMSIDDLIEDIKSNKCTECFSCGTAAIITPICSLHEESGERYNVKEEFGPTTKMLRETLLGIQEQTVEDQFNWVVKL